MKQIEVQIMGTSYVLGCPEEGEPELLTAVDMVDKAMCRIRDAGKTKARERVAVLAALNIAVDLGEQAKQAKQSTQNTTPTTAPAASVAATTVPATGDPVVNSPATEKTSKPESDNVQIAELIARIDVALGDNGLLL